MSIESITVDEHYQFTIPEEIRKGISIEVGDEMNIMLNKEKEVIIYKFKKGPVEDSFGIWTGKKSGVEYVNEIRDEAEQRLEERGI